MRIHVWPVVAMIVGLCSVPALAIWPEDDPPTEPGIQPDRVYQVFKPDSIDLSTGTLSMMLPLGRQYPVSSGFQYGIGLSYDSSIWDYDMWIETGQCEDPTYPFVCERRRQAYPDKRSNAGLGWRVSLGHLYAPMDPLNPTNPYWIYVGPDGSQHRFWERMYSSDRVGLSTSGAFSFWYTTDGSYLRMKFNRWELPGMGTRWVEFPDGSVHTFTADEPNKFRLHRTEDASGNGVDVLYGTQGGNPTWTLSDGYRTHAIEFEQMGFDGGTIDVVSKISLAVFGGGTADYLFTYYDSENDQNIIDRSLKDSDEQTEPELEVPLLAEITLPDGTSYSMDYHREASLEEDDVSGLIREMRLPTLGWIEWQWQTWEQPGADQLWPWYQGDEGSVAGFYRDWPGIKEKTYRDRDDAEIGTWQYDTWTCDPIPYTALDQERQTVVTSPVGDAAVHYFRALPKDASGYEAEVTRWDFALPFTRRVEQAADPSQAGPLFLSVEHFAGDIERTGQDWECTIVGEKKRSTYVRYENTWRKDGCGDNSYRAITRHPVARRLVYDDDGGRYRDTYWFDFDGHGNFRTRVDRGSFEPEPEQEPEQKTFTNYNAGQGTFKPALGYNDFDPASIEMLQFPGLEQPGDSFQGMLPAGGRWILHRHDVSERFAIDHEALLTHSRSDVCFDENTDLLVRTRALEDDDAYSAELGAHDVITVYGRNLAGEIARKKTYGGDNQTIQNLTADLCSQDLPSPPKTWMEYDYQYGTLQTATPFDPAAEASMGYLVHDWDIDQSTGKPTRSRDTAGLPTEYEFDDMGRLTWIRPTGQVPGFTVERGAYTQVCYTPAQGDDLAQVEVLSRTNGETGDCSDFDPDELLAFSRTTYDDIGRLSGEYTLLPDGTFNQRLHGYDGLGRETWVSEWQEEGAAQLHTTQYTYDLLDRPTVMTPPDGAGHKATFSYVGDRQVGRTAKVGTWRSGPMVHEETVLVSTQTFDVLENLWKLIEPAGPNGGDVETTYTRDADDRLRKVSIASGGVTQHRTWTYDGRGFLVSETVPEKDNGTVWYSDHNVRGQAGSVIDGPNHLVYEYDPAGRLVSVRDVNNSDAEIRALTYGNENGTYSTDLALGKLKTARAENHFYANPDVQGVFEVTETYIYGGVDGRPSRRETMAGIAAGCGLEEFNVDFRWSPMGDIEGIEFPPGETEGKGGSAAGPQTGVEYTYDHGVVTGVDYEVDVQTIPVASMTYYPNLMVNRISLGNGARTSHEKNPRDMARPRRIRAYNATNFKEWDSGTYLYDGVGNIKAMKTGSTTAHTATYDGVSRITEWAEVVNNSDVEVWPYGYDGFGNLGLMRDVSFQVYAQTNHISGAQYDGAGNLTEWGGAGGGGGGEDAISYTYYPTNELETMSAPTWSSVYAYSAGGERVARYDDDLTDGPDGTTHVIRDLNGKPLRRYYETGCSFAWQQDWIWRDGLALATVDGDGMRFFHLDHLGTPRLITKEDGTVAAYGRHDYYPFGTEIGGPAQDGEAVKFTGHERDLGDSTETHEDLDYMHARYYSSNLGRFLSVDPVGGDVGSSQSWNRYSYVLNNPINGTDPTGEIAWFGAAAGAAIDIGVQMIVEKKSFKEMNWVSVSVSATSGATGVGLGRVVAKNVGKTGLRIAANSAGSAVIGGVATTANTVGTNVKEGNDLTEGLTKGKVLTGVATNAAAGGLGAMADEALLAGGKVVKMMLDQQDLLDEVPFYAVGNRGEALENAATGVGNAAGTALSNSGVVFEMVASHDPLKKPTLSE